MIEGRRRRAWARWLWIGGLLACDDGAGVDPDAGAPAPDARLRDASGDDARRPGDLGRPDATPADHAVPLDLGTADATPADAMPSDAAVDAGCTPGEQRAGPACGLNGRGEAPLICRDGVFVEADCADPDVCVDDGRAPCPDAPGEQRCVEGQWDQTGCGQDAPCPPSVDLALDVAWEGDLADEGVEVGTCGGRGGERAGRFVAPAAGRFAFDTQGSDFDTVLHLRAVCADPASERGCNDDARGVQSRVEIDLQAGEAVIVFIDGFDGGGRFRVTVSAVAPQECVDGIREERRCEAPGERPAAQLRDCLGGTWTGWSACTAFGDCVPGAVEVSPCRIADGPGESTRTCDDVGRWSPWSDCEPTGGCFPGVIQWEACEIEGTQRRRACEVEGAWSPWSDCIGAACPPLSAIGLGTTRRELPPGASAIRHDCGDGRGSLETLRFVPDAAGQYAFWLQAPAPMLAVRAACDDDLAGLACATYTRVAFEYRPVHAQLSVALEAGAPITVMVGNEEPAQGVPYVLNVAWRDPARCVDEPADNHDWARALPADQVAAAFGGTLGLVSTDQCGGQPDWFAMDVPMGCNLTFAPLRTLYGRAAVGLRRPDSVEIGDSGLLGPFSRIIGVNRPGTYRLKVEPTMGDEPQTLVSAGLTCRQGDVFHCGRGADSIANDDPAAPALLEVGRARSEPICAGDVDHFEWTQGAACHSRLTVACPRPAFEDIELTLTDAEGAPIPAGQVRPEPGLGPIHGGWVIDRPAGSDRTRLRLQSADPAANARCDLLVEEFCLEALACDGVGALIGDHGLHAFALCDRPTRLSAPSVPAGCTVRVEQRAGPPATLTIEDAAGVQQAQGEGEVSWRPALTAAATVWIEGADGDRVLVDAAVRCP